MLNYILNNKQSVLLFLWQMLAHAAIIYGIFNFTTYQWLCVLVVYFITGSIGMSITYHRLLSHSSFVAPRWFEILGTISGTLGLTGSSLAWVNNHRAHHRFTDTDKDPHSPKYLGFLKVQFLSMFTSSKNFHYVGRIRKDNFHLFLHKYYFSLHSALLVLLIMTLGFHWTAVLYLAPAAILWHAGSLINTICHSSFGYTNYLTNDSSKNNIILGVLVWGEGYHNNHHASPTSAKFGKKWWEFDVSWFIIKLVKGNHASSTI